MKKRLGYIFRSLRWKNIGLGALIVVPIAMIAVQFMYPLGNTARGAAVNGVAIGGLNKDDAKNRLQSAYNDATLNMYFGSADAPARTPKLSELGVQVESDEAVEHAMYPWWLRLVPTSLWWAHRVGGNEEATVTLSDDKTKEYIAAELGRSCRVEPKNASIVVENDTLKLVEAMSGGECETEEVVAAVDAASLTATEPNTVRLPVEQITPKITNDDARSLIATINEQLNNDIKLVFKDESVTIDTTTVRSWLRFVVEKDALTVKVDTKAAKKLLDEKAGGVVAVKPGVLTIVTRDFTEISRRGGPDGRAIDVDETSKNITGYLMKRTDTAEIATRVVKAKRDYHRSYTATSTGLSALSQHYAEAHQGVYGVSLVELSGKGRQAGYNATRKFTTASTYKVYVAYSVLRRIDDKKMKWSDTIAGGRDAAKCFDDMIVQSDNPCAEAFVQKISYNALHADVQALGLGSTSFIDAQSFKTSAGDLTSFMSRLETKKLPISKKSRATFISALKRNVHRNGIPAGTSGTVADKVGFLDGFLHDTAIVYDSNGTYVLTIMTDGSSWGNIAGLTKAIEELRAQ